MRAHFGAYVTKTDIANAINKHGRNKIVSVILLAGIEQQEELDSTEIAVIQYSIACHPGTGVTTFVMVGGPPPADIYSARRRAFWVVPISKNSSIVSFNARYVQTRRVCQRVLHGEVVVINGKTDVPVVMRSNPAWRHVCNPRLSFVRRPNRTKKICV